nr:reverse transcriptase domain-containing protein [Tanacetum cinerariifolium]
MEEKTKRIHDFKIKDRIFNVGDRVLLFNSRLKIFSGKLKTHWTVPFTITQVFPYGTIELSQTDGLNFKVIDINKRKKLEDVRLAKDINALCMRVSAIVDERVNFVNELDMLEPKLVPRKMAEFIKEIQDKDIRNLMKLQIIRSEFELRVREKDIFIEKLKGNLDY